jgi:hypothetical protein
LKWRTASNITAALAKKFTRDQQEVAEFSFNNPWLVPALLVGSIVLLLLFIAIALLPLQRYRRKRIETDQSSFTNASSTLTSLAHHDIDEFLASNTTCQSIISQSKSSIIYQAWMNERTGNDNDKRLVAVKLYQGTQCRKLFDNEVEMLRLVYHPSIIS